MTTPTNPEILDFIRRHASPWLNAKDAASYLSMGESTLGNHRTAGTGPRYRRMGKGVLYHRDDLDAWVAAHPATTSTLGEVVHG